MGIPVAEPFSAKNLEPAADLVIVGNALSRGNPELNCARRADSVHFDGADYCMRSFIAGGPRDAGGCRDAWQDDDDEHAGVDL
jgi:UDP-N-acetylmuramate: L-alanyl-gamma-D-glutamyl-meso-diaminopimelate ligase